MCSILVTRSEIRRNQMSRTIAVSTQTFAASTVTNAQCLMYLHDGSRQHAFHISQLVSYPHFFVYNTESLTIRFVPKSLINFFFQRYSPIAACIARSIQRLIQKKQLIFQHADCLKVFCFDATVDVFQKTLL